MTTLEVKAVLIVAAVCLAVARPVHATLKLQTIDTRPSYRTSSSPRAISAPPMRFPLPDVYNVVWNVPGQGCDNRFPFNLTDYGILINHNDTFTGNEDHLFYQLGKWPSISSNGSYINGGIPQLSCLQCHLDQITKDIDNMIPDTNFSGLGIVDFESWRPVFWWNWDSLAIYQTASINHTKAEHPDWTNQTQIHEQAETEFNQAAQQFFEGTIKHLQFLRPSALWGYYQFPYCPFNGTACSDKMRQSNRQEASWLWRIVDVLYPEIYQYQDDVKLNYWTDSVAARVNEALQLAAMAGPRKGVLPYGNLMASHTFPNGTTVPHLLSEPYLAVQIETPAKTGADGVVIWGSSASVRTTQQCIDLQTYIHDSLGPMVLSTQQTQSNCSETSCSGHGRCVSFSPLPDSSTEVPSCRCFDGFAGDDCSQPA